VAPVPGRARHRQGPRHKARSDHECRLQRTPAEARHFIDDIVRPLRRFAASRFQRLGWQFAELVPVLRGKPAKLAEAVGDGNAGDARFVAGAEQLLASALKSHSPHPAQRRRAKVEPEMRFQRARPNAGDGGEGIESNRLIRTGIEPIERLRKTGGQSISHVRQTAGAVFRLFGTLDHAPASAQDSSDRR
jgi:hypothetical protein